MFANVVAWYAKRIVNVNVNVVAAGLLAIPVLFCIHLTEWALRKEIIDGGRLHMSDKLIIGLVTFVSDICFDVLIYYCLHFLANHAPLIKENRKRQLDKVADAAIESVPFFKDATKVQVQRAVLSPLLYILWIGMQQLLMHGFHMSSFWATIAGFCMGVGTARALHTFWMLREERRVRAKCAAAKLEICSGGPPSETSIPPSSATPPHGNGHAPATPAKSCDSANSAPVE